MKKTKLVSLLSLIGVAASSAILVACNNNSGDLKPKTRTHFLNCYARDYTATYYQDGSFNRSAFASWVHAQGSMVNEYYRGYVGTNDSLNVGPFRVVEGSESVTPGEEVNLVIELDPLVELNPVVGTLKRQLGGPYPEVEGGLTDSNYCKVYMSNDYTDIGFLPSTCYTFKKLDNSHWSLKIPGEYTQYSYDVLISASYMDFRRVMIEKNIYFDVNYDEQTKASHNFLMSTNGMPKAKGWRVGDTNFAFSIKPFSFGNNELISLGTGVTVTQDFADKLIIQGIPVDTNAEPYNFTEVIKTFKNSNTILPTTNVVGAIGTVIRDSGSKYLNCTMPFVNANNPKEGLFTVTKDGEYKPNYQAIQVCVDSSYQNIGLPIANVDEAGVDSRIQIIAGEEQHFKKDTAKAEVKYFWQYSTKEQNEIMKGGFIGSQEQEKMPIVHIHLEPEDGYILDIDKVNSPIKSFVLNSALDEDGDPYIENIDVPVVTPIQCVDQYVNQTTNNHYPSLASMINLDKVLYAKTPATNDGPIDFYFSVMDFTMKSQIAADATDVYLHDETGEHAVVRGGGSMNFFDKLEITFQAVEAQK